MKIIFLEAVQNFGGARKSTLEQAKRLMDNGNEVLVIDLWGSCTAFVEETIRLNLPIKFIDKRAEPIIFSHPNKLRMGFNFLIYSIKWLGYRRDVIQSIKMNSPDLVIVNNTKVLSLLTKSNHYKIALFARGWFLPTTISPINRFLIKNMTDIFLAVSQSTRQAIFAGGFAKLEDIYVVPNAIDSDKLENFLKEPYALTPWYIEDTDRPFTLLHCGGFLETKGQHIVLEVAKELKKRGVNFKVKMVGIKYKGFASEQYFLRIKQAILNESLENEVEIILDKPNADEYFVQADVLIHPSSTEGLPRVVMEAMCLGKPIIANAVGGVTDFVLHGYTGYLTNFNKSEEYVEYIQKLISQKSLYKTISNNSRNLINNSFTAKNQITSFMQIAPTLKLKKK